MSDQRISRRGLLKAGATGVVLTGVTTGTATAAESTKEPTIYIGSNYGTLYAADAATGKQEWAFTEPSGPVESSPTVVGGTVYVGSSKDRGRSGVLYAVDAATGTQKWAFTGPSEPIESSPTIVNETVYVGARDGTLYAVDAITGEQEWAFSQDTGMIQTSPTVLDGVVYVASFGTGDLDFADATVYAVDAVTGEEVWRFSNPSSVVWGMSTTRDTTYVSADALYAVNTATGKQRWAFAKPQDERAASPTVVDETVYVGFDDILYAVDTASGDQEWSFPTASAWGVPTVADGTVYFGGVDSILYAINAETGVQEWEYSDPDSDFYAGGNAGPTVYDGIVYVGAESVSVSDGEISETDGQVYAVDAATGEEVWTLAAPKSLVRSSPTVVEDPQDGDSVGSRVDLGTLGHHHTYATRQDERVVVTGEEPATDTTGDGKLNDVNGDGEFDIFDVQAFYTNLESNSVQDNAELFDFSESGGQPSIFDVQALYRQLAE